MQIGELARRTGLTVHTIRYNERIGLLPPSARAASRHRDYDDAIMPWIAFLGRLKATGMPIREMLRYAGLRAEGPASESARRALLAEHRDKVRSRVAELEACLSVLDVKIAGYGDGSGARTDDTDNGSGSLRTGTAGPARD